MFSLFFVLGGMSRDFLAHHINKTRHRQHINDFNVSTTTTTTQPTPAASNNTNSTNNTRGDDNDNDSDHSKFPQFFFSCLFIHNFSI